MLIHLVVEQGLVFFQGIKMGLYLRKVIFTELGVNHELLRSLFEYFFVVFLGQLRSYVAPGDLRIQSFVSYVYAVFPKCFLCFLVELLSDFALSC